MTFFKHIFSYNWSPLLLFLCFASRLDIILGNYENSASQFFHKTRRIVGGVSSEERSFMVYLLKSEESKANYTDWLCGATLIKEDWVLSSAACVKDVEHMYAMAGTKRYIKSAGDQLMADPCLKCMKKKVITKIHPDDYQMSYTDNLKWATNDIALLQVDEPYSKCPFKFGSSCDYRPWPIQIDVDGEKCEDNLFTLGWGSETRYRESGKNEDIDVNSKILRETSVSALSKKDCKEMWGKKWDDLIDKSMICTLDKYEGKPTSPEQPSPKPTPPEPTTSKPTPPEQTSSKPTPPEQTSSKPTPPEQTSSKPTSPTTTSPKPTTPQTTSPKPTSPQTTSPQPTTTKKSARRRGHRRGLGINRSAIAHTARDHIMPKNLLRSQSGFCQNDHGGPLVDIKDNGQLIVVGVSTACRITKDMKCVGPFLYTSTHKHRCFLLKHLKMGTGEPCPTFTRRYTGSIVEHISWKNHPDGNKYLQVKIETSIRGMGHYGIKIDHLRFKLNNDRPFYYSDKELNVLNDYTSDTSDSNY